MSFKFTCIPHKPGTGIIALFYYWKLLPLTVLYLKPKAEEDFYYMSKYHTSFQSFSSAFLYYREVSVWPFVMHRKARITHLNLGIMSNKLRYLHKLMQSEQLQLKISSACIQILLGLTDKYLWGKGQWWFTLHQLPCSTCSICTCSYSQ